VSTPHSFGHWPDARAREALARYDGVVRRMALRFRAAIRRCTALDQDDLCAEGRLAVLEALDTYGGCGVSENTWVHKRVQQRMIDAIRRIGTCSRDELRLLARHACGEALTDAELERARMTAARRVVSLDSTLEDGRSLLERIADREAPYVDDLAERLELAQRLRGAIGALRPRQRLAIELWLQGLQLRESSERMDTCIEGVWRLRQAAVRALQAAVG